MNYPSGTFNLEQTQDAIYDWIEGVTRGIFEDSLRIIWRDQSEAAPPRPFVSLKFTYGPAPIARDASVINKKSTGAVTTAIQMEATLSIQVFGNTKIHKPMAYQLAIDLNSSLLRQSVKDSLKKKDIAIQSLGKPQNMTALEESQYEERAGFEVGLGLVQNLVDDPGFIETINVQELIDGSGPTKTIHLP